jgi:rare lipoprotein A
MRWILLLIPAFLIGCSSNVRYKTQETNTRVVHKKFNNNDPEYKTKITPGNVVYMNCSYYAEKFHGKPTANGEIFDMNKFTCAHKTLPFGTRLKVTNEDNNKSVIVRVNDRGPFVKGRDLDLSKAAAREIGLIPYGVKRLRVEFLGNE